jgi:hypothetical protein
MDNIMRPTRCLFLALALLAMSGAAFAQIGFGLSITFGPPALPVYVQPPCPAAGYIWVPGYWAYDPGYGDYYWVPGTWVLAPAVGLLWTPGYWGWSGASFIFHEGYWGPVVGFYGGINYGFGYAGEGYQGGRWQNGQFYYNRTVNNINVTNVRNVYNEQVTNITVNRVSYNGGNGGITARPSGQDEAAARERHVPPVAAQTQQVQAARSNQQLRASVNHGKPPIAATPKPGAFNESGVVAAKEAGAPYKPATNRPAAEPRANAQPPRAENAQPARPENGTARPNPAVHPQELPPAAHVPPPNTGNAQLDRQYQQQQEQLRAKQNQERQAVQQKQEQEHQRLAQQNASEERKQQVEQQHQKQTEELQQKHAAEVKQMQEEQRQHQAKTPQKEHPPTEKN